MKNPVMELEVDTISRWKDISGNGNHFISTSPVYQPQILTDGTMWNNGACYDFDGNDNFFYKEGVDFSDMVFAGKDTTFSFWFNLTETIEAANYVWRCQPTWYIVYIKATTALKFYYPGTNNITLTTLGLFNNLWHFYCITINNSTGIARLYIDGKFDSQDDFSGLTVGVISAYIGGSTIIYNALGQIVRPRIYNYCASGYEIAAQYKQDKLTLKD